MGRGCASGNPCKRMGIAFTNVGPAHARGSAHSNEKAPRSAREAFDVHQRCMVGRIQSRPGASQHPNEGWHHSGSVQVGSRVRGMSYEESRVSVEKESPAGRRG